MTLPCCLLPSRHRLALPGLPWGARLLGEETALGVSLRKAVQAGTGLRVMAGAPGEAWLERRAGPGLEAGGLCPAPPVRR